MYWAMVTVHSIPSPRQECVAAGSARVIIPDAMHRATQWRNRWEPTFFDDGD